MPIFDTAELTQTSLSEGKISQAQNDQLYCALDSCVTLEVFQELGREYNQVPTIYNFARAMQAPYLEIMQRGFKVDETARHHACAELREKINYLQTLLNEYAGAVWDKPLNPRSPLQLQQFFYQTMKLPEVWLSQKGVKRLSTNREALEKLDQYLYARPFVNIILQIRDFAKQLSVFETEIDPDSRYRTSYNIAGTETGRPSSSENAFGTGGNAQNIAPTLRYVFVADKGWKICVIDLEQVEARDVGFFIGNLFGDWAFLDNCESGDLHTNNCKLVWPDLGWTGDKKQDRELADQIFYRDFSYRDMSKRGGHLCLTPDHEVLTRHGWTSIANKPDEILSFSKNKAEFALVQNWIDEEYQGELISHEGNSISALMTPNHRVPFIRDAATWKNFYVQEAQQKPVGLIPLGWGYVGGTEIVPARLIAAFMSDGSQKSPNRMEFHITKARKIERLEILCKRYGFYSERVGDKTMVHGYLPKRAGAFMLNWTKDCIDDFLDEYKHWDGHASPTAVSLFSVDKSHLEWLQTLGRISGIGGQITSWVSKSSFGGKTKTYVTDYHRLGQNKRQFATAASLKFNKLSEQKTRVYCPTVSSSFFFVRRNGKIFVTGNSNYYGTPFTMARSLKIPIAVAEEFQARYVRGGYVNGQWITPAFPGIARWWQWTAQQLQTLHYIETPFQRKRYFFGRPGDDTTLREAIAFLPQSTTADRMNLGLWRVWKKMPQVQLLAQTYDSITFQYQDKGHDYESSLIQEALQLIRVELKANNGRSYIVPGEAKLGWNWGPQVTQADIDRAKTRKTRVPRLNIEGLTKWKADLPDPRQRAFGLDRIGGR